MTAGPLAIKLGQARVLACLTQAVLAERIGVSRGAVAHIETGRVDASIDLAERWARACGCRFAWTIEARS